MKSKMCIFWAIRCSLNYNITLARKQSIAQETETVQNHYTETLLQQIAPPMTQ